SVLMRVLLPAPFSPQSACTSPFPRSKETPSSAFTPGNSLLIALSSRRAIGREKGLAFRLGGDVLGLVPAVRDHRGSEVVLVHLDRRQQDRRHVLLAVRDAGGLVGEGLL